MSEHTSQCAVIKWCMFQGGRQPELKRIFAIPNGGKRHKATAGRLKEEGVRPGVPDLFLPVARGGYHGLFIEMKEKGNGTTDLQEAELAKLEASGYCTRVCHGSEDAIKALEWYMLQRESARE